MQPWVKDTLWSQFSSINGIGVLPQKKKEFENMSKKPHISY